MDYKEPIETEDPNIRTEPYYAFRVNPYGLFKDEYQTLTTPFKYTVLSSIFLGMALTQIFFVDLRKYLDSKGPFKIEDYKTDIIITVVTIVLCVICFIIDLCSNSRRALKRKIKEHYKEDSKKIDEQRKKYA